MTKKRLTSSAEDHYTADYPEDEVDSDDEYDRNAYHYRTHNASDLEEFDEHDATYSDDEIEKINHPWMKRTWRTQDEHVEGDVMDKDT